jgi:hypothetical protein
MQSSRWLAITSALVVAASLSAGAQPAAGPSPELQFRFGGFLPSGGGNFWTETEETFTLESSDFNDVILGFTAVASVNNHVGVGFSLDSYDSKVPSSYRDWVDQDGFGISHDTELDIVPMIVDVRFYPGGRDAIRGSHGQIRALKPAFYLGGGVGANYWEYEERGEFLDFTFDPPDIFFDRFRDDGFAFAAQALVGVELPLGSRWNALFEGRYSWSEAELGGDFDGLGTLDLGGVAVYAGFGVRF